MGVSFFGDYDTTETVIIPFNTFTSDDPSASSTITNLVAGDIEIHKDGGTTQRASDNGVTVTINFDGITGNHIVSIDLSDNSDAGFYSAGSRYQVRMEGTTVDDATINAWVGAFSVGCTLRPTVDGRTLDVTATGAAGVDWGNVENQGTAVDLSATDIQLCDTVTANSDMRGTDNAALASVVGALADAAAAGDPTASDTIMQYLKQLVNVLVGTTGVTTMPAAAAPANNVSLAEIIRAIYDDTNSLDGTKVPQTMNLTASGNIGINWGSVENPTTAVDLSATDIRLCDTITTYTGNTVQTGDAYAVVNNGTYGNPALDTDLGTLITRLGTPSNFGSGTSTIAANLEDIADNGTATYDRSTDSLQALRDHVGDGTNLTEAGGTGDHLTAINLPDQTMNITGNITGNLSGSVGSLTGHTVQTGDVITVINKLPSKNYLTGTNNADGDAEADEFTGSISATISSAAITDIANEVSTDSFGTTLDQKIPPYLLAFKD